MKRIILLFSFLLIACLSYSQVSVVAYAQPSAGAYSAAYQAVYDKMDALGNVPGADTAAQQNIMFNAINDTANLDIFHLYGQQYNEAGQADLDWIAPTTGNYDAIETGAGTLGWASGNGYNGDGTNYLALNFNPSTDATYLSLNSASCGVYLLENRNVVEQGIAAEAGGNGFWTTGQASDLVYGRVNQASSSSVNPAGSVGNGFFMVSRTASNAISLYQNGASILDATTVSSALPNDDFETLAQNGTTISQNTVFCDFVAEGLSPAQVAEINRAVEVYADYLGVGVEAAPPAPMLPVEPIDTETLAT